MDLAEEIRRDYRRGLSTRDLAKKYRMSLRDIGKVLKDEGYTVISKKKLRTLEETAKLWDEFMELLLTDKELMGELGKLLKTNEQLKELLVKAAENYKNRHHNRA